MMKKLNDLLAGLPMTIVAGVFLLLDLIPHLTAKFGAAALSLSFLPFDPAWVTIVISGIPLSYLAIWRIIHEPGHPQDIVCPFDLHRHVRRYRDRQSVCGRRSCLHHGHRRAFRGSHDKPGEKKPQAISQPHADNGPQAEGRKRRKDTDRRDLHRETSCASCPVRRSRWTERSSAARLRSISPS